jgi:Helix-turn-helix domain
MNRSRSTGPFARSRFVHVSTNGLEADLREAGVMAGSHTRWVRPDTALEDPERVAIREALAFGKAVYDRRVALRLNVAEVAERAGMAADDIECIEEGGTEPTVALLRRLAAALDADVRLTPGHDLGSVGFEAHAA